jgi:hypothetical protein
MFRTLALASAVAALALPAVAGTTSVTINVAKLDAPAVHQAIARAAKQTCTAQFADSSALVRFYATPDCVSHTVATAEAKYAAMRGLASR